MQLSPLFRKIYSRQRQTDWSRCREQRPVECSALNGTSMLHPLFPRCIAEEGEGSLGESEVVNEYKGTMFSRHNRATVVVVTIRTGPVYVYGDIFLTDD